MNKTFELYASDLTEEAQKNLCETAGIKSISEANWDVFPITTIDFEVPDTWQVWDNIAEECLGTFETKEEAQKFADNIFEVGMSISVIKYDESEE